MKKYFSFYNIISNKIKLKKRINFIINYKLNDLVINKFKSINKIKNSEVNEIINDFKFFFIAILIKESTLKNGKILINNDIVESLWDTFITDTYEYKKFSEYAFGHFLHHNIKDKFNKKIFLKDDLLTDEYIIKSMKYINKNVKGNSKI